MRKVQVLVLTLVALALVPALASASDNETFTVTVSATEAVDIDTGTAPLTVDYTSSSLCSVSDRFCNWYPAIIYETNYASNRKLVAKATVSSSILSVKLVKQAAPYDNPYTPSWGSGTRPGSWASGFSGPEITLSSTDQDIVVGIQNGKYAIAPILRLEFSSAPTVGTYTATVTFTIMAE